MAIADQADRFSRQILFAGIGAQGQRQISASRVSIIGCGALGALQAEMLARAGVGFLRLIDRDLVEESNLHRQVLYDENDVGERLPKAVAAARRLSHINSKISAEPRIVDINYSNVEDAIRDVDVVLDGTDNFETRFLLNDAAVKLDKPWVFGGVVAANGLQMTIRPHLTPCLRCIFPEMPPPGAGPTCDTAGVILPIIGLIVSLQVTEAIKILTGQVAELHNSLVKIDVWSNSFTRLRLDSSQMNNCPACGNGTFDYLDNRSGQATTILCGRNAVQVSPGTRTKIDFERLKHQLQGVGTVEFNEYLLRFATGDHEITVFRDGRGIIRGTEDPNLARSLYARYIGV